ncbi:response regulator [Tissierella sp. MSJ-40]|uniref:Response regulator n=1 Tax=Tissierella simiarum TaxID=2841534 RepID=A0ABS6EAI6_9FIRM|nr:response regulator [Tissierella simiarum]MBU5439948.1 response regulator [Tissierella simiarum]
MKIFILDDDLSIIRILKKIIFDRNLGIVIGDASEGKEGLEEILATEPDLVLIDMLMSDKDGLSIVKELKEIGLKTQFIMISQVSSKQMVEKAYRYGVEYYIYKPINALEVETIIKRLKDKIELENKMMKLQQIFNDIPPLNQNDLSTTYCEQTINAALLKLGVIGEKGSKDIVKVVKFVVENKININDITIREICSQFTENPKSMEQRIRRTVNIALGNLASLGIEDYMNETFVEYSNTLFNFEQVKKEMDYIRQKSMIRGSINIKKFLTGLAMHCENKNN